MFMTNFHGYVFCFVLSNSNVNFPICNITYQPTVLEAPNTATLCLVNRRLCKMFTHNHGVRTFANFNVQIVNLIACNEIKAICIIRLKVFVSMKIPSANEVGGGYLRITMSLIPPVCLSVCLYVLYSCPVHIFLKETHWKFLLHKKIAYDLRVCHEIDPRLLKKVKITERKGHNLCLVYIFLCRNIRSFYFTRGLLMPVSGHKLIVRLSFPSVPLNMASPDILYLIFF